jgi:diadenosine tetraphosphatase ApaH/serine/threonine PP2A family protein phosphatase
MTKRPNWSNKADACCSCGHVHDTPKDHEKPGPEQLHVWQPTSVDPPQWICAQCKDRLEADERRTG